MPGRPTDLDNSRTRVYYAGDCFDLFFCFFLSLFLPFSGRRLDID